MKKTRIAVATLVLTGGVVLTACSSSADTALSNVRQACGDMGYENGSAKPSDPSATPNQTSDDWAKTAADYDDIANRVAHAARDDSRWNRLSNAVTDATAMLHDKAVAMDETATDDERYAAQERIDNQDFDALIRTVSQECRKAQAE